ncbi:MAG: PAS domain S-box protein, partial [Syntrophomonas sp.]
MTPFKDLIISHEKSLTKRLFHYAFKHNYAEGSAAVEEAWSNCVAGLSGAILQSIDTIYPDYEFGPDHDFRNDPLCEFIVDTAKRHRERGVSLQMFHGLMVYYKEAWLDLVKNSEFAIEYKNLCLNIVARMFDRFMIALCAEWAENDQSKLIKELQVRNREAIVEKNKFLTIFESTPNPLLIIDELKLIVNFNYAAAVMMNVSNFHGSQYYYPHIGKMDFVAHNEKENSSGGFHAVKGQPVAAFFPWLDGDLDDFITGSASSVDFEKEVLNQEETKCFNVKLSRWSDVSKTFVGGVVILEDITKKKRAEQELRLVKEKQRERILLNENRLNRVLKILQHGSYSVSEFLDYALDEAITLTGSKIGYILYYDENTQEFIINSWSRGAMQECSIDYKPTVFHLKDTGIWGEAVRQRKPLIINDFTASNPLKRGYPEGHVHIDRFIEIPVFNDNDIVAVVAVANKESDYDQTDMLQLSLFMNSVWKSVNMKKMEEALFKSEEQYRTVFETTGSATVIIDENGTVTLANGEFCKLSGYSKREIEHNKNFNEFIEPNDLDKLAEYFRLRQMEPDTVRDNCEFRAVNRQGKAIDLIISVSMIPGTRNKVVSMVNITDRKQTESALRRSEDKFSKV